MRSLILTLSALLVPAALIACGSSTTGNTGGAGGSAASSSGSGGTASSSSGSGGTASTSSTTSSSSGGTGGSGTGGSAGGACTNAADLGIVQDPAKDVKGKAATCGQQNLGADPATKNCIVMQTGLSDGCAQCFADTVACAVQHCLTQCLSDPNSQACTDCRAQNCDPAFYACSGLPQSN